ncbi:MAG: alpha/beta hydrolase [Chromatiales bacterium]|nr:alpha/beta hydrolase [Chromatiales bacterium]
MKSKTVVLVHGIWMTGYEMSWLGQQLKNSGYEVHYFRYSSLFVEPRESAQRLQTFIKDLDVEQVDLIGHSLGGIILLHLFSLSPVLPPGRIVLLGSPVLGSGVARRLSINPVMRLLLGNTTERGLLGDAPSWQGDRDLGVIAGERGIGVGSVIGGLSGSHDGTVAVAETRLPGATDFCTLRVGHFDMLFSRAVARQTMQFLRQGRFDGGSGAIPAPPPVSDTPAE